MSTLIEKDLKFHNKIAELATLADSIYDNEFGRQISHHIPVYGGKEFLRFVEKRYGAISFRCRNVTFYALPFEYKERNDFEIFSVETKDNNAE